MITIQLTEDQAKWLKNTLAHLQQGFMPIYDRYKCEGIVQEIVEKEEKVNQLELDLGGEA